MQEAPRDYFKDAKGNHSLMLYTEDRVSRCHVKDQAVSYESRIPSFDCLTRGAQHIRSTKHHQRYQFVISSFDLLKQD